MRKIKGPRGHGQDTIEIEGETVLNHEGGRRFFYRHKSKKAKAKKKKARKAARKARR